MVTFTPQLSHVRFGRQQASIQATPEAPVTPPVHNHDQVSFSAQSKAALPQVQFGALTRRSLLAIAGALGVAGAAGACAKSNSSTSGTTGGNGAGSTGETGGKQPIGNPDELLPSYKTNYKFPTSFEIERVRKPDASEVSDFEGGKRNELLADMPKHMMWLLGYENPMDPQTARAHSAKIDALPYASNLVDKDKKPIDRKTIAAAKATEQIYKSLAAENGTNREKFRVIAENVREDLEKPLEAHSKAPIGALLPDDKRLGSKIEGYEAAYALFMLKMILDPAKYEPLVNNNKLVKATKASDGNDSTCIQFYDYSDKAATSLRDQQRKETDKAQENVDKIFQSPDNKDLTVFVGDASKLKASALSDSDIRTIGKSGIFGGNNLAVFVDTAKLEHDPVKSALALYKGLKIANGEK